VKAVMAGALCAAGARALIRSVRRREAGGVRVLILSYHRLAVDFAAESRTVLSSLLVSTRTLVRQLEQLGREREIVSLADACRLLAEPAPRRRRRLDVAVVTFDDGYASCHELGLPVIQRLRVPASIFVATGYIGTERRLPHDRLWASLSELNRQGVPLERAGLRRPMQQLLEACAEPGPAATLDRLIARLGHDELIAVAGALEARTAVHEVDLPRSTRILSWDELRELAAAGVDVGGHTVHHTVLSNIPASRASAEITGCVDEIALHLGSPPRHFAYPNGYHTPAVRRMLAAAGFQAAVTTEDTENQRGGDLFRLKRKSLWENSTLGALGYNPWLAACNLDGVFGALGWVRPVPGERPDATDPAEPSADPLPKPPQAPDEPARVAG
jgi:peptidoglycan/xylan/chitin deacetylase (PgdA/CDA1 family)